MYKYLFMHVQYNGVCETEVLSGCDLLRDTGGRVKLKRYVLLLMLYLLQMTKINVT